MIFVIMSYSHEGGVKSSFTICHQKIAIFVCVSLRQLHIQVPLELKLDRSSFCRAHFTGKKLEVKQLESNPTASTYSMHSKSKDKNFDRAIAREMYGSGGRGIKPLRRQSQERETKEVQ